MDEFLNSLDDEEAQAFRKIRDAALKIVPNAEEGVSYGMQALKYQGKGLIGFRKAKTHLSIFPFSPQAIDAVKDQLKDFDVSKGTVRFTKSKPLPQKAVNDLIKARVREIEGR